MATEILLYKGSEKSLKEFCGCGSVMNCKSVFDRYKGDDEEPYYLLETYKILLCPGCESVTIVLYQAWGDRDEDEMDSSSGGPQIYAYKRKILYGSITPKHNAVPQAIADVISQAEAVIAASPRASVILCRAALEEICSDFDIPAEGHNKKGELYFIPLGARLENLVSQEHLDDSLKQIVKGIQNLGNIGAHSTQLAFAKQVKVEDATSLLDLVHYVTEKLYVQKFRELEANQILKHLEEKILKPFQ